MWSGRSVSVQDTLHYFGRGLLWFWQDLFYWVVTLGSLEKLLVNPPPTLLPRGVARWISRHERRRCNISRDRPSQVVVSEGWITRFRRSDYRGRSRQRVARFIHQTFSSSKYHRDVLVPRHVPTREIRQEYFQERPLHHSLQESKRSIRHEEFGLNWVEDVSVH